MLDPNVRAILERAKAQGRPAMNTLPIDEARKTSSENNANAQLEAEAVRRVRDVRIPGPHGEIPLRIFEPDVEGPRPAVVYYHGGGWVLCDLQTHHEICCAIARRAGAVVVAVDYRRAPEYKFPVQVEEAYAATVWVAEHCEELGIDAGRLCVCGDSAGGNLATVVAMKSRELGGPQLALQVLVYPVTDLSSLDTPSYLEFAEGHQLTKVLMEWFRDHYLSSPRDARHPYASPLLANDLSGLPPALIITAECDPLRDEGEAYAQRLEEAGVEVRLHRYEGMIHPFFSMSALVPQTKAAHEEVAEAVRSTGRR